MIKQFVSIEELKPYYNEKTNTYEFIENDIRGIRLDVEFKFHLIIKSHIIAGNINAEDIDVWNIIAWNIIARDVNAWNINYYAVCLAYKNITCTSIKGIRENAKHLTLDGEIKIKPKGEKKPVTLELTDEQLEKIKVFLRRN